MRSSAGDPPRCAGSTAAQGLDSGGGGDPSDVPAAFGTLRDALELGDADWVRALLDDRWTIRHLTGDEQSKEEWVADIESGDADYASIDVVETALAPFGDRAVLTVRTLTEATLFRVHAVWRMQHRIDYERRDGVWTAMRAVTRSW